MSRRGTCGTSSAGYRCLLLDIFKCYSSLQPTLSPSISLTFRHLLPSLLLPKSCSHLLSLNFRAFLQVNRLAVIDLPKHPMGVHPPEHLQSKLVDQYATRQTACLQHNTTPRPILTMCIHDVYPMELLRYFERAKPSRTNMQNRAHSRN